ncbi:MAG: sulfotransferase [Phycisphaeraceae bacterium]|nr:sulfotransferase [Phycisphaeraceae bacterium]
MSNAANFKTTPAHLNVLQAYQRAHQAILSSLCKPLFFIVGCQKSGTTWVKAVLDGHPEICCRGEAVFGPVLMPTLQHLMKMYNKAIVDRNEQVGEIDPNLSINESQIDFLFVSAVGMMLASWSNSSQAKVLGEKTPEHAICLNLLNRFFPHCKVIHIIRDGRDVAVSGWFHNLRYAGDKFKEQFPDFPSYVRHITLRHWKGYVYSARAFGAAAPDRYHELRYEHLKTKPEELVKGMLTFLNVDSSPEMVARCVAAGSFDKLSQGRKPGEENRQSFFRKGVTGDWRNHFDDAAMAAFMESGGDLMRELGYEA